MDADFSGLRVAAFESRRATDIARMIERQGGLPFVSPSMREVACQDQPEIAEFANQLVTGQIDTVILLTGVGFRHLLDAAVRHVAKDRFLTSLADIVTVVRGPKPAAAMQEYGLTPTHRVPEPHTWREILDTVDRELSISNQTVGLQEYGQPNPSLIAGLEARGGRVFSLRVYRWDFPEDVSALDGNLAALARGERDVSLFTSAHQVRNVLERARQLEIADDVRTGLRESIVCSVGPTTSETLRQLRLPVDFEPSRPKMGPLVNEAAAASGSLARRKQRIRLTLSGPQSDASDPAAPWYDSPFLRACRRQPNAVTPIWLMGQAGRYLPAVRDISDQMAWRELCRQPTLCAEIMVQTVATLGVDAAIILSDLLPLLEPMGINLTGSITETPAADPVRAPQEIDRIVELESVDALDFVMETVRRTRQELPADVPLIGFSGAPFTLASYAIEGGLSGNCANTKTLMLRDAGAWRELMQRFSRSIALYLNAQIASGVQCVQLFDPNAGCLGPGDYAEFVLPFMKTLVCELSPGVPVINFAVGNPALLRSLSAAGPHVVGVDWRVPLDEAWQTIGYERAVQGNLDPLVLTANRQTVIDRAGDIVKRAQGRPGHIFNLGRSVLPHTPVDNVRALVDAVHAMGEE